MHRRALIAAVPLTAALLLPASSRRAQAVTRIARRLGSLSVTSTWGAPRNSQSEHALDRFTTTITAFVSQDIAAETFADLLAAVRDGTLYSEETGAQSTGDGSFFVRYNDPNFVVDEFTVRIGALIYRFHAEAIHYGGARDAYRLMETILARANPKAKTEDELVALLPTTAELAPYSLTEPITLPATATPASS